MEDQPIFNNYANPGRNQVAWIEQLSGHFYWLKTGKIKATAGAAIQYQWGKLVKNNWKWFPETSVAYTIDDRVSGFLRNSWFHYRADNRLGFMLGLSCNLKR